MTGGLVLTGIFGAALALAATGAVAQENRPESAQEVPRFRSSVDLVSVAAVVRDRKGRFVTDLSRHDFEIVEAGEPRPILDFRSEVNGPVRVALLVDVSGSMRVGQKEADARQAAGHLFASLAAGDQAAVYTFDTMLSEAQPFTTDRAALADALEAVEKPFGQTSLYDAIAETARMVASAADEGETGLPERSAVAVITDGIDTRSRRTAHAVAVAASGIDVPVYIIAVMSSVDDPRVPQNRRQSDLASDLRDLARGTGGDLFIASAPAESSVAARQIVSELRHQYVLAFEASDRTGWRPLEVRTRQRSLTVRARTGYHGGAPASGASEATVGQLFIGPAASGSDRALSWRHQQ